MNLYEGLRCHGVPLVTISRGRLVYENGIFTCAEGSGKFCPLRTFPDYLYKKMVQREKVSGRSVPVSFPFSFASLLFYFVSLFPTYLYYFLSSHVPSFLSIFPFFLCLLFRFLLLSPFCFLSLDCFVPLFPNFPRCCIRQWDKPFSGFLVIRV